MLEKLKAFENKEPEIVFSWKDPETEAVGWTVINSLRNGAAGGGTRMRKGLNKHEVVSLAKTMEIKFTVAGPPIGGAKSGINFDPDDPRKEGVLRRWYQAVLPLLKTYYGTGGDLNVDEVKEVLPITADLGLLHCQEGVAVGHFKPDEDGKKAIISRLQQGVSQVLTDERYCPALNSGIKVADMITGWGVSEAARLYYDIWGYSREGARTIVQGFGNVGGAAAYYQALAGFKVVGIIDRDGGLINEDGFTVEEIKHLLLTRDGNALSHPDMIPFDEINEKIWTVGAEVFLPCARSRIITVQQIKKMLKSGLKLISPGANVPFKDSEIFLGPTGIFADELVSVIPDFVANCGMARAFAYFMSNNPDMSDHSIFQDVTDTIAQPLRELQERNPVGMELWQDALYLALDKLDFKFEPSEPLHVE